MNYIKAKNLSKDLPNKYQMDISEEFEIFIMGKFIEQCARYLQILNKVKGKQRQAQLRLYRNSIYEYIANGYITQNNFIAVNQWYNELPAKKKVANYDLAESIYNAYIYQESYYLAPETHHF